MTDTPPLSADPEPLALDPAPPVECKKCAGRPGARRHAKGCPNVSPEAKERQQRKERAKTHRPRAAGAAKGRYAPALTQYAGTLGTMLNIAGNAKGSPKLAYDGEIILINAEQWAATVEQLALEDERVARVLDAMVQTSAWSAVMMSTAAIALPILACHGFLPAGVAPMFGAPVPPQPEHDWRDDGAESTVPPADGYADAAAAANGRGTGTTAHTVAL